MLERDLVYLELLSAPRGGKLTQLGIAKRLGISVSTVSNAIKPLREMGAITVRQRCFEVMDRERALIHLASSRNTLRDVSYKTRVEAGLMEIERGMPSGIAFTAYSGFRLRFKEAPADYSEVFVYADESCLEEIMARFPKRSGPPNLFVLSAGQTLLERCADGIAPAPLIFADLWNMKEWYSRDFIAALKKRMGLFRNEH